MWSDHVIGFQKIFGLCGLKGHIGEIWRDVTLVHNGQRTTECEDRARILETEFAKISEKDSLAGIMWKTQGDSCLPTMLLP